MARPRKFGEIKKSEQRMIGLRFHPLVLAQIEKQAKRHGISASRWVEASIESIISGALTVA